MKTQSLADVLGLEHPRERPVVHDNAPAKMSAEDFCKAILNSSEFRVFILNGLVYNSLPPAILVRIMDQGWGKPVARLEVTNKTPLEDTSNEELETRALMLAERIRTLKRGRGEDDSIH